MTTRYENYFNRNKELYSSHIERAVKLFEDILDYDPLLYSYLIKDFFKVNRLLDSTVLNAFWLFYTEDVSSNRELNFYYRKDFQFGSSLSKIIDALRKPKIEISLLKNPSEQDGWKPLEFKTEVETEDEKDPSKETRYEVPVELAETGKRVRTAALFASQIPMLTNHKPSPGSFDKDFEDFFLNFLSKPENKEQLKSMIRYIAFTNPEITFHEIINIELFGNLMYSYLKGEYLILDNYSELLRKVKSKFKEAAAQKQDSIRSNERKRVSMAESQTFPEFPYALKSFVKLSLHGDEICSHIRRVLTNPQKSFVIINSDIEARVNSICPEDFYIPHSETLYFEQLAESIINLTHIDHCFIKNKVNVQKMAILVDRLNIFEDTFLKNHADNHFLKTIVEITKYKAFTLFECLDRKYTINDPDLVNIVGKEKIGQEYQYDLIYSGKNSFLDSHKYTAYSSKMEEVSNENKFLRAKIDKKDELLVYDDLIKDHQLRERLIYNSHKDVDLYNDSVELGIRTYCAYSSLFVDLKSRIIGDEPDEKAFRDNRSHTFFISYLTGLSEVISNKIENFKTRLAGEKAKFDKRKEEIESLGQDFKKNKEIQKQYRELFDETYSGLKELKELRRKLSENINKYNKILSELNRFLEVYKYNVPHQYRPFLEYSFYKYDPETGEVRYSEYIDPEDIRNYKCDEVFGDIFFFASLGISPVPRKFLVIFHMEKMNDMGDISENYQEIVLELERFESIIKTTEIREYNAAQARKVIGDTTKQIDDAQKDQTQREEKFKEDTGKIIDDQRRHTIQILGIFAAFLAFTTTTIGLVQIADNITEYIIFCAGFTLSLVFFVMLIKYNFIHECREQIGKLHQKYKRKMASTPEEEEQIKIPCGRNCWHHIWALFRTGPFLPMILLIIVALLFFFCFAKNYFPDKKEKRDTEIENTQTYNLIHHMRPGRQVYTGGINDINTENPFTVNYSIIELLADQTLIWK
ncbi:MAG: hypothetical protein LUF87_09130 [Alistipes sp.]|nr:hypothetical protein [Alistipes sp.]MCD7970501.1 hypothetical protein [Alistipes sp.]